MDIKPESNKKIGILAWPGYSTRADNPYNYIIYSEVEKHEYSIYNFDFSLRNILKTVFSVRFKILHMHWPANILTFSTSFQAKKRLFLFFLFIKGIKLFNIKVIWTVHNMSSHESQHPELERWLYRFLYSNVDGFISLNKHGIKQLKERTWGGSDRKFAYIPHPHYIGYYDNTATYAESRQKLNIPTSKFVFLFLGQIRLYKNVIGLIEAFLGLEDPNAILLIAGNVHIDVKEALYSNVKRSASIILVDSFVGDGDLQYYMNASDLVVCPYSNVFNSGSVFLNLSFNKPTLVPSMETFVELAEQVDNRLIKLYNGTLTSEHLGTAKNAVISDREAPRNPDLAAFSPTAVATDTMQFYKEVLC